MNKCIMENYFDINLSLPLQSFYGDGGNFQKNEEQKVMMNFQ